MIIHQPELYVNGKEIVVEAYIEIASSKMSATNLPKSLWFSFPRSYQPYVVDHADGFLTSLILNAMYFNEDIEIRAKVSPRLAYGLEEFQRIFNIWFPKKFKRVNIKYDTLEEIQNKDNITAVATAFTGGVDSFYTLWRHLPQNQSIPAFQVTHGIFVLGWDIDLGDMVRTEKLLSQHRALFKRLNLDLIIAKSNVREFSRNRIDWIYAHGGALIGTALVLGSLIQRFYVPSTFQYNYLDPIGTSPLLDHLLGTASMEIIHDGAATQRFDKIDQLVQLTETFSNLRVCTNNNYHGGYLNCGKCHKCIHTIVYLETIGELYKYNVFANPYSFLIFFRWFFLAEISNEALKRFIKRAIRERRFEITLMMLWVALSVQIRKIVLYVIDKFSYEAKHRILEWKKSTKLKV